MSHPVEVRGLAKSYFEAGRGEVQAVRGIDFFCQEGEIFGLLGANGAGKTSTLRMLSTVLTPTAGTAEVMGHDLLKEPEAVRRNLGFFSASTALYPRLTARETVEFFARINGYPAAQVRDRVEELIARIGLTSFANTRVDQLSSGMKQKVSIARTVAHDPPILIFDEPTVGLDVLNALEFQKVLQEFRSQGKCILLSTHIMSEAEKLCDRIAIIHGGKILACDTLEGLRAMSGQHYLEDIFVRLIRPEEPA
ncbi:MAG: ABC transporter ATP-binding protein [Candidatus Eremiobacterota bacterium]